MEAGVDGVDGVEGSVGVVGVDGVEGSDGVDGVDGDVGDGLVEDGSEALGDAAEPEATCLMLAHPVTASMHMARRNPKKVFMGEGPFSEADRDLPCNPETTAIEELGRAALSCPPRIDLP